MAQDAEKSRCVLCHGYTANGRQLNFFETVSASTCDCAEYICNVSVLALVLRQDDGF